MKSILIIANPKAGNGKPLKILPQVSKYLTNLGFVVESYLTQNTADYEEISGRINREQGWYAILIIGGDGTLNDVINSIPENCETPVMVLPSGSGNDFAKWLYKNSTTEQILDRLVISKTTKIDIGTCNGKRFINGLGIGYDGWVAGKSAGGIKWLPASLKYHLAILRGLFTFHSFYTSLGQALIIAVANGPTYGGGFRIAPNADPGDGQFDLWQIKPIPVWKRPYYLSLIKKGEHANNPGPYHNQLVTEINIQCHKPVPAHLDGEYFEAERFEVRMIQMKVSFII